MRFTMTIPALILSLLGLAACETVEGAGQDLQSAGQAIEQESNEVQAGY